MHQCYKKTLLLFFDWNKRSDRKVFHRPKEGTHHIKTYIFLITLRLLNVILRNHVKIIIKIKIINLTA